VFNIHSDAKDVNLKNLTIAGGNGRGIYNEGGLALTNVWITNNPNGGIQNNSELFTTNVGIDHSGGAGLKNYGTAFLVDSRIEGTYDAKEGPGDGIQNGGTLIVDRGLIAKNQGSGLSQTSSNPPECPPATTYLLNVTISGHQQAGVDARCGQLILRHVTIAENTQAGLSVENVTPVLENSIVAKNGGKQCYVHALGSIKISYSLIGDNSCNVFPGAGGNLVGVDPKLNDALTYRVGENLIMKLFHIGANRVHALLPGSPAIDSGADEFCTDPFDVFDKGLEDQLGVRRPIDGDGDGVAHCDMGAYEYQPTGSAPK
jgi:hypothetical protein